MMIAVLVIEIMLIAFVLTLDILPGKYIVALVAGIIVIDCLMIWLINDRKPKSKKRLIGAILCGVMIVCSCVGSYFAYDTYKTMEIISAKMNQTITYDVVVLKDSVYEDLDDIEGQTVYSVKSGKDTYAQAKQKLESSVDMTLEETTGCMDAGEKLVSLTGIKQDNILFISDPEYDMTDDIIQGFKKETKVIHKITVKLPYESSDNIDVLHDSFNVLISGIDSRGEISDVARSDVNMIVTVNPQTRTILLTSIPRDAYVPLHTYGEYDKLTHTGIYGVEETLSTVEDWLDIDLNYYVKVNFSMVVGLVNAIDGITLYNEEEFQSSIAPYWYKKGWITMHGKKTLYYARERKWFEGGDARRTTHQQKVMEAIIKKVSSSEVILTHYTDILAVVSENMTMNLTDRELKALARMQLSDMDTKWTIEMANIKCEEAERGTFSMGMGRMLFVNIPKEESVEKVKEKIHDVMYPAETEETDDVTDLLQGN